MRELKSILNSVLVGDALQQLQTIPDNSVDVTVTSPPYNKRNKSQGWLVDNKTYSHSNDQMPEKQYQSWQIKVLEELYRVTKPGGSVFYNHKIRWVKGKLLHPFSWVALTQWTMRQEIIWDRILAANVRGWRFWQVDERIYWLYKPINNHLVGQELESNHAKVSSIWRIRPVPRMKCHPAPFPLEIPVRAIYSMPGIQRKVVLDPFCGTGTTLVAAKLLGHQYLGIDLSPDYARYTYDRLENSAEEEEVFEKEIARHVVADPFSARKERGTVTWPYGPSETDDESDE